jgi:hypothetical protein
VQSCRLIVKASSGDGYSLTVSSVHITTTHISAIQHLAVTDLVDRDYSTSWIQTSELQLQVGQETV